MKTTAPRTIVRDYTIPAELKEQPNWLVWVWRERGDRIQKIPVNEDGGYKKNSSQGDAGIAAELLAFNAAMDRRIKLSAKFPNQSYGVGFVFTPGCGYVGIDLDRCLTPEGVLRPWARKPITEFGIIGTYIETSPSGTGLKAIVKATLPKSSCSMDIIDEESGVTGKVELYYSNHYFTITGAVWEEGVEESEREYHVEERQGCIDKLYEWVKQGNTRPPKEKLVRAKKIHQGDAEGTGETVEDRRALVQACLNALSADVGYDRWFKVACAVYTEYADDLAAGFEVFHEWSKGGSKYSGEKDCYDKWSSKLVIGTVKLGTLLYFVKQENGGQLPPEIVKLQIARGPGRAILEQYWWCEREQLFVDKENMEAAYTPRAFTNNVAVHFGYCGGKGAIPPDRLMLMNPELERCAYMTYWPHKERIFINENHCAVLNTWTPAPLSDAAPDGVEMVQHLMFMFNNDVKTVNRLIQWFAAIVQGKNGGKIRHGVVIISKNEQTGKGVILEMLKHTLRAENLWITSSQGLMRENFNDFLFTHQLVAVEETDLGASKQLASYLKMIVGNETFQKRGMYQKAEQGRNVANLLMFTNEDTPLPISINDKRFWFLYSCVEQQSEEFYLRRFKRIQELGESGALVNWLRSIDLSDFNVYANAPATEAKLKSIRDGLSPAAEYVLSKVENPVTPDGATPFERRSLMAYWQIEHWATYGSNRRVPLKSKFKEELKSFGVEMVSRDIDHVYVQDRRVSNIFALRDAEYYRGMGIRELIRAYRKEEDAMGMEPGGQDDLQFGNQTD